MNPPEPGREAPGDASADDPLPRKNEHGAPLTARSQKRGARARKRGGLGIFLLAGALPVAAIVWFLLQPEAQRNAFFEKLPAGWTGRAIQAAIAFGVLFVLARVALPAFHGSAGSLRVLVARLRVNRGAVRVLLYPFEVLVGLLRILVQILYAVDAALILVAALVLLLVVVRILKPEFLPGVLPMLGG
jgi:hypothetical protein